MVRIRTTPPRTGDHHVFALCIACVALLLALPGCPKREPAQETLAAMRAATLEQGRITRQAVHSVVAGYFGEVETTLRARVQLRRAELHEEIHRRAQTKVDDVSGIAIAQLEAALEGPVARLDAALREEQAKPFRARDRALELELAVQLSTTLAALGRESDRLVQQTAQRTTVARDRALALVDSRIADLLSAPQIDLEPEALAVELLDEFERASRHYDASMVAGLDDLERQLHGSEMATAAFAKGLFGDRLGEQVARRAAELRSRGEAFLGEELRALYEAALERLDAPA